jgi:DNA topoisomerase-6 subunit B
LIKEDSEKANIIKLRIEDNGSGIPTDFIPLAFCQFLFSSKYKLKQARGTFGLGGTMSILYGQITSNKPVNVISSTGGKISEYKLMIDIERNRPVILDRKIRKNKNKWHGTIVEFTLEGDYFKAMSKILDYLKQTAIVNPYANITFVDPKGRLYKFEGTTKEMPPPPKETDPHPHGVDVETLQRIIRITKQKNMVDFMKNHFHRVGLQTALRFVKFADIPKKMNPKTMRPGDMVKIVQAMKSFNDFLPPDANCLSPLGEDLLRTGVLKELEPEFLKVHQRKPSAYSGHPFVAEVAIAYGGKIPAKNDILLYRFANKIPLVYDESGDVSWTIVKSINWRRYGVMSNMPIAVFVHLCSTKVPYKTVGKEIIADRPEVRKEILNGIREVARHLRRYLSRKETVKKQVKRVNVFARYLPKIAKFSALLGGFEAPPEINRLYKQQDVFKDFRSTNQYLDSEIFEAEIYPSIIVHVKNKHANNAVTIKVLGFNGVEWKELTSEITLPAGSELYETLKEKTKLVKIQVKSATEDKDGKIDAFVDGLSE